MIAAVDHIAYEVNDEGALPSFLNGKEPIFRCHELLNSPAKKHLLREYSDIHSITYYKDGVAGIPVEVTHHRSAEHRTEAEKLKIKEDYIIIETQDAAGELSFFKNINGFSEDAGDSLVYKNRFSGVGFRLKFINGNSDKMYLDDIGFTCIAFISTDINQDAEELRERGAVDFTEPFVLTVNGKELSILMLRSPGGIPIELIMPKR
ncbi:MAG: VOC family protein [Deferribacterales bacterium]|jgi:hypothetical protein